VDLSLTVLGVGLEPIEVSSIDLIFGSRKLEGALTGNPATGDETLRFSALSGVYAMIETVPLEGAADAYAKMMAGKARFRIVLTMDCCGYRKSYPGWRRCRDGLSSLRDA
jgi:alcohol dehydrogenase, propanol-preferring